MARIGSTRDTDLSSTKFSGGQPELEVGIGDKSRGWTRHKSYPVRKGAKFLVGEDMKTVFCLLASEKCQTMAGILLKNYPGNHERSRGKTQRF